MFDAHSSLSDHTFSSRPMEWVWLTKTLPYWLDDHSNVSCCKSTTTAISSSHDITGSSDASGEPPIMVDGQHCDDHVSHFSSMLPYKEKKTYL